MLLVHQAQILNGDAGLLQGSRSSVVRASTAKVGGLGFDSQWLPKFFPSVCFYSDLPPVVYQQFLLPVVVIRIITKIVMHRHVAKFVHCQYNNLSLTYLHVLAVCLIAKQQIPGVSCAGTCTYMCVYVTTRFATWPVLKRMDPF